MKRPRLYPYHWLMHHSPFRRVLQWLHFAGTPQTPDPRPVRHIEFDHETGEWETVRSGLQLPLSGRGGNL